MLTDLMIDDNYMNNLRQDLEDENKFNLNSVKEICSDDDFKEFLSTINKVKSLSMEDIIHSIKKIENGIYETNISIKTIANITKTKLKEFHNFSHFNPEYGMADNFNQILKHYKKELSDPTKKYVIICEWLYKDSNNPGGGFRYHKNGVYIGDLNPKHEHFNDDTHIKKLLLYSIILVEEENVKIDDYTSDWLSLSTIT